MSLVTSFSATYGEARKKFIAAAGAAGAEIETIEHPERGPEKELLRTDVAWLGPRSANSVLVMISATHGVEGFAGSAAQIDWLNRGEATRLPDNTAALLIHAINPYGFAWLRRVTNENVDLNRNWVDFAQPLPRNSGYDELASAICPAAWVGEEREHADRRLAEFAATHGKAALQHAVSGGQFAHAQGVFYGGSAPTWSRRTQSNIFAEYLRNAAHVGIIDFHTGLGPCGFGEHIAIAPTTSTEFRRVTSWYGIDVTSPQDGTSTSAPIVGDGLSASGDLLPNAQVTAVALEFGTVAIEEVLNAVRADAWLHAYGDPLSPAGRAIKLQIRAAFVDDSDYWRGMILGQSQLAARQAIRGLSNSI